MLKPQSGSAAHVLLQQPSARQEQSVRAQEEVTPLHVTLPEPLALAEQAPELPLHERVVPLEH
ncbi:hypothetical protein STIAU_5292 [Stigmatella aurantiaca DW4/3-1]|uniref:Uncharacterized protein n=1 Tax=Stigmatella aurantiaca (strain DW4/3-1) TaxID=378806 RepID=Q090M6_STIAD|nr:hypothetical protein STIAU_5292 [Stigmatella aurantiaca DW4/3-1]